MGVRNHAGFSGATTNISLKCIGPEIGTTQSDVETQRQACNNLWRTTDEAATSRDYKLYSESEGWRKRAVEADGQLFEAVECEGTRVLKHMSELVKTRHPDRAQATVNPTMLEAAMQPALKQKLITRKGC